LFLLLHSSTYNRDHSVLFWVFDWWSRRIALLCGKLFEDVFATDQFSFDLLQNIR